MRLQQLDLRVSRIFPADNLRVQLVDLLWEGGWGVMVSSDIHKMQPRCSVRPGRQLQQLPPTRFRLFWARGSASSGRPRSRTIQSDNNAQPRNQSAGAASVTVATTKLCPSQSAPVKHQTRYPTDLDPENRTATQFNSRSSEPRNPPPSQQPTSPSEIYHYHCH